MTGLCARIYRPFEIEVRCLSANGTLALELALEVLGSGDGDDVIVMPRTFLASASCVIRLGRLPSFADV